MKKPSLTDAMLCVEAWTSSNHYSLNKMAWKEALCYLYDKTDLWHQVHEMGGMFFTLEDEERYEDLHYMVCAHPRSPRHAPFYENYMGNLFAAASKKYDVFTQGFDEPSKYGCAILSQMVALPDGDIEDLYKTLPASKRSALRRSVRDPYVSLWSQTVSDWAWSTYVERWKDEGQWSHLQMVYARSMVKQGLAQTLSMFIEGQQVAECYFVTHANRLKFIAATFAQRNSIGMASQVMAIKRCYALGLKTYDPTECSNYEEWDYNNYKGMACNAPGYVYCYAAVQERELVPPYARGGNWILE